ncbi:MAG TPA: hypothetical protein VKY40_00030 [Halanaerobiales bacterium]|nr:hypothetical protein [Halanaerobiales bacterium]
MAEVSGDLKTNNISENISEFEFLLFLILIMLLMGNQNTFSPHFELLNKELNSLNTLLQTLSASSNGLKSAVNAAASVSGNKNNNL